MNISRVGKQKQPEIAWPMLVNKLVASCVVILATVVGSPGHGQEPDKQTYFGSMVEWELTSAASNKKSESIQMVGSDDNPEPGNAAAYYRRAYIQLEEIKKANPDLYDEVYSWSRKIDELPLDKVNEWLAKFEQGTFLQELDRAFRCPDCEWGLGLDQRPLHEWSSMMLTEMGPTPRLYLYKKIQVEIAKKRFDSALKLIRNGLKRGRDFAKIKFLIGGIGGSNECQSMLELMGELSQQPGSPNLYRAFLTLPQPIIDLRPHLLNEIRAFKQSFPWIESPMTIDMTPAEWRTEFLKAIKTCEVLFLDESVSAEDFDNSRDIRLRMLMAELYPIARNELIRSGMAPEKIDALPVGQVVAIQTSRVIEDYTRPFINTMHLPAIAAVAAAEEEMKRVKFKGFGVGGNRGDFPISDSLAGFSSFTPAFPRRIDRETAIMINIEAIRDYMATNEGRLPGSWDDVVRLRPIPDPKTGRPFVYRHQTDGTAVIETEAIERPNFRHIEFRYVLSK